ncbi:MAG: putative quinol monooxygenase [Propionibacteriaceae bacterium]
MTASSNVTDPVVVTAIFHPAEGSRDAVLAAMAPAIAAVHEEQGCLLYAIHDAPDGSIVMIEKWESVPLLDAHGQGAAVAAFRASMEGLTSSPTEVTRLFPIPMGEVSRGAL